ncbi:hypothetical protein ACS0TY_023003 [Phlomoides rotata]
MLHHCVTGHPDWSKLGMATRRVKTRTRHKPDPHGAGKNPVKRVPTASWYYMDPPRIYIYILNNNRVHSLNLPVGQSTYQNKSSSQPSLTISTISLCVTVCTPPVRPSSVSPRLIPPDFPTPLRSSHRRRATARRSHGPRPQRFSDAALVLRDDVFCSSVDALHSSGEKFESIRGDDGGYVEGIKRSYC